MPVMLLKSIPDQIINEGAAFGPVDLKIYFNADEDEVLHFQAALEDGASLPSGMICTDDGLLTGIPAAASSGIYQVVIAVQSELGSAQAEFLMIIKPSMIINRNKEEIDAMKAKVWQALKEHLPVPETENLFSGPITDQEFLYLIERWGVVKIWDAFNLDPASEKKLLKLDGTSPHYDIYDRGCYLIACPKDLYSHERTLADGIKTAQVLAKEAYKRGWTVELTGHYKLTRAAWIELQYLGDKLGKHLDIINFDPTINEVLLYKNVVSVDTPRLEME